MLGAEGHVDVDRGYAATKASSSHHPASSLSDILVSTTVDGGLCSLILGSTDAFEVLCFCLSAHKSFESASHFLHSIPPFHSTFPFDRDKNEKRSCM